MSLRTDSDGAAFDPREALTVKEAAAKLHASRPTVEKYIRAGELPSALIGRCRRIRRADLEAPLERRTAYGWQPYRREPTPVDPVPDCFPSDEEVPF
jgi:excisionase family DNA binding protein